MDSYGAASFTSELWTLLLSAQETVGGVPAAVGRFQAVYPAVLMTVHRCEEGRAGARSTGREAPAGSGAGERLI